jgi:flagellar export protein FliJ
MAFRFRFQSLLHYREHLRAEAQTDLADAIRRHDRTLQLLEAAKRERRKQQENMEQRQRTGISANDYVTSAEYLALMEQQLVLMEIEVQQFAQEVLAAKERVLQRQTEVRMLECIEINDRARYSKIQNRRERAQLDENAIVRDARARRETQPQD